MTLIEFQSLYTARRFCQHGRIDQFPVPAGRECSERARAGRRGGTDAPLEDAHFDPATVLDHNELDVDTVCLGRRRLAFGSHRFPIEIEMQRNEDQMRIARVDEERYPRSGECRGFLRLPHLGHQWHRAIKGHGGSSRAGRPHADGDLSGFGCKSSRLQFACVKQVGRRAPDSIPRPFGARTIGVEEAELKSVGLPALQDDQSIRPNAGSTVADRTGLGAGPTDRRRCLNDTKIVQERFAFGNLNRRQFSPRMCGLMR